MSVPDALRIVQLNLAYDRALNEPDSLLASYHTLTGWSTAVSRAGASVYTVQRFSRDARLSQSGGDYVFVADGRPGLPDAWATFDRVSAAVRAATPDVVHINGLMFPGMVRMLRQQLPPRTALVLQDHSGHLPRAWPWPLRVVSSRRWRRAFAGVDACAFTAGDLANRWHRVGLAEAVRIIEIPPAGTDVSPIDKADAMRATGVRGAPAILWVGRLDANKDPVSALEGLEMALPRLPNAHCWMVYGEAQLEDAVRARISDSPVLAERVTMVGAVAHERIGEYFSAADIFLSGSHHEGSGYSLIEAMACGVMPCVTNIPSFRALIGDCGVLWKVSDPPACAAGLLALAARDRETERRLVRARYDSALSWDVIGQRTVREYRALVDERRSACGR